MSETSERWSLAGGSGSLGKGHEVLLLVYSLLPDSRSGLGRESSEEPDSRLIKESPDHRLRQRELPGSWLDCLSREGSMS